MKPSRNFLKRNRASITLILLAAVCLLLPSCIHGRPEPPVDRYPVVISDSTSVQDVTGTPKPDRDIRAKTIEYDGHLYVYLWHQNDACGTFLHSPDCPCHGDGTQDRSDTTHGNLQLFLDPGLTSIPKTAESASPKPITNLVRIEGLNPLLVP